MKTRNIIFYFHEDNYFDDVLRVVNLGEYLAEEFSNINIKIITDSIYDFYLKPVSRLEYIKLPTVFKHRNSSHKNDSLNLSFEELISIRKSIILETVRNFKPNIFIVDNVPSGFMGEILNALKYLKMNLQESWRIFLMKDILDEPDAVKEKWENSNNFEILKEFYHQVWIQGSPLVFDPVKNYQFPQELINKSHFLGYFERYESFKSSKQIRNLFQIKKNLIVTVSVGDGRGGYSLIETYIKGLRSLEKNINFESIILLGPYMPSSQKEILESIIQADVKLIHFRDFYEDTSSLFKASELIVSTGCFHDVSKILFLKKKAIIIPETSHKKDSFIRAKKIKDLGLVETISQEDVSPSILINKVLSLLSSKEKPALAGLIPFRGFSHISNFVNFLLASKPRIYPL